ncbi:MAG: thiamine-phosphate kinase [Candidatus Altiarchaeota archaeon]|nr:thiamine-phosphate kinase [Candidatus Altiarchaeota archaeon]
MASIPEFGGEFALIDAMVRKLGKLRDGSVVVGIGDDTAVIKFNKKYYLLWTVDMLVEGDHFRRGWSTPKQVGMKAMEANVSDIAAMGGFPKYALVSISLPDDVSVEYMERMYEGMQSVAGKHGFSIIGGNTTHGKNIVVDTTIIGLVEKDRLRLRSGARVGDLICVTGDLGKSKAGLELLLAGKKGYLKYHLEPKCRLKEARVISKHANAMIDVSDGLASEVCHICDRSGTGAMILKHSIPLSKTTIASAKALGKDPFQYALNGGEDYEIVFTIPRRKLRKMRLKTPVSVVGVITGKKQGVKLLDGRKIVNLSGGFDHFIRTRDNTLHDRRHKSKRQTA